MRLAFVLPVVLGVVACQPATETARETESPAVPSEAGAPAPAAFDLRRAEGAQVAWVEAQVGPARTVIVGEREYDIDGCTVRMNVEAETVTGYAVPMTPACSDLALPVLEAFGLPQTVDLTFAQFAQARTNPQFKADCLHLCGNAADPWIYFESPGPRVSPGIRASAPLVDAALIDASFDLRDQMRAAHGDDYVIDARFNCDTAWSAPAGAALGDFRIQEIEVGYTPIGRCG